MGLLDGRVAIVTGGARGIGYGTTRRLVQEGASVCFADLDEDASQQVAKALGDAVEPFVADLLDPAAPAKLVEAAVGRFGALDIVVNSAGFYWDSLLHEMSDEQWQAMLDIHMTVPFRVLRAAAPHLFAGAKADAEAGVERFRKVVNVSSLAASFGNVGAANYSAAKAGVIGLTKALAKEWGRHRINVNAVAFGVIQTRMGLPQGAQNRLRVGGHDVQMGVSPKRLRKLGVEVDPERTWTEEETYTPRPLPGVPLGRAGSIDEAAATIFYLCSPLSDYVTGQVIAASGGAAGGMS